MPVIDVDCHFDVALRAAEHPLREWADRLPTLEQYIADANSGDLRRNTPEQSRPDKVALWCQSQQPAWRPVLRWDTAWVR
jgi:hypothetical protein